MSVFGIISKEISNVAASTYYGLFALQHRGQESCGIVVCDDGLFRSHKAKGIVNDVFTHKELDALGEGNMAIGHVRYGADVTSGMHNKQPVIVNHYNGHYALANQGSLINGNELRIEIEKEGSIFHSRRDVEVIAYLITKERIKCDSVETALEQAMYKLVGSYALLVMSPTKLIAARDPRGFHPLCYGITKDGSYVIASESCALDSVGAQFIRDVLPGEIVVFDTNGGVRSITTHCNKQPKSICVFEYLYTARPDSVVDGYSVHRARLNAGKYLAKEHPVEADVVIGVPDSGLDAALGYSKESGIPYGIGFIKNKYIGRTFIDPGQKVREEKVKIKLNVVSDTVKGKRVVLVDDSIVRGTTSARIVKLLRDAGAKEVHMRSSAPQFLNPCYYGTDIASRDVLIAANHTIEEMEKIINVDTLGFLSVENLGKIIEAEQGCGYCHGCFTNVYPTEAPKPYEKSKYEYKISERKRGQNNE